MHPMAMDIYGHQGYTCQAVEGQALLNEPSIFSLGLTMLILFVLIRLGQIALAGLTAMIVLNLAGKFTDIEVSLESW